MLWAITRAIRPSKQTRKPETIIACTTAPTFFFSFFVSPRSPFSSPHDKKIISVILLVPSGTTADQWRRRLWHDQCCQHPPFYIIIIHLNVLNIHLKRINFTTIKLMWALWVDLNPVKDFHTSDCTSYYCLISSNNDIKENNHDNNGDSVMVMMMTSMVMAMMITTMMMMMSLCFIAHHRHIDSVIS